MTLSATIIRISILAFFAPLALAAPRGDGKLSLYNDARKEALDITFRNPDPIPSAVKKIAFFLRSPDDKVHEIDVQLLDLLDNIQDQFSEPVVEIISGYRSPDYNHHLKQEGRAVANESLHMKGQAIDIHLDTTTEEAVRDYAWSLSAGGVGWYPQNDFVHIDLGPVRQWGKAESKRKWVGLDNNSGPLFIRTNTNRYFLGETIHVHISPKPNARHANLERFDQGQWKKVDDSKVACHANFQILASNRLKFGRYRIVVADSLSNEFYIKQPNVKN